jgi:hypothetical protein
MGSLYRFRAVRRAQKEVRGLAAAEWEMGAQAGERAAVVAEERASAGAAVWAAESAREALG